MRHDKPPPAPGTGGDAPARTRPGRRGRGRSPRAELVDVATLVSGVRAASAELWQAARAFEAATSAEADCLVALAVAVTSGAPPDEVARAHDALAASLRGRDDAAARLGVAGPDALAPQLLGLLASGRLVVTR